MMMRPNALAVFILAITLAPLGAPAAGDQQTFASPEEAAKALIAAAGHDNPAAMLKMFGPTGKDIVDSGDPAQDKSGRAEFARRAAEKMHIEQDRTNPDRAILVVGSQDWPFPIPMVRKNGQWKFDTAAGRLEILARRVGRNEMNAMEVCRAYVEAQMEYGSRDRDADGVLEYAQRIVSGPGKHDGLYWEGEPENLVPKAFAEAAAANYPGGGKHEPYHGYYFRILKAQGPAAPGGAFDYVVKGKMIGGFALVAYPAEYSVSGVNTFIVSHKGVVYEKDLGPTTTTLARQMTLFNPDKTWKPSDKE
jgi:hypothetical protein